VDLRAIDHCFADINMFEEYKKSETLLTRKMAKKRTSFGIIKRSIMKIVIEIGEKNTIDLIL